ncbi:MAG: outer membrane lipoprotein-sorting protein [Deltaproteobacteria bacterium]|nr:MAG: outer membrane lipoprotein-sorting protein [Deltaproteobacteria bacterium]
MPQSVRSALHLIPILLTAAVTNASPATAERVEHAIGARQEPSPAALTGRDIYQRVLDNRFRSYIQESTMVSGDRGGNTQETELRMWFQSFRGEGGEATDGVLSKTLVRYQLPFDLRHTGYLIIHHPERSSDQFVYLPTQRRVRRVSLRGEAVFGTDFSFEDVIPREIEHAEYERRPDSVLHDIACFVVEAVPKREADSEYSRFLIYVDQDRYVPLRTRYFDDAGVEVKALEVDPASIERVADVWVPMRARMRDLRLDTFTEVQVEEIEPNPVLGRSAFELRRLEAR